MKADAAGAAGAGRTRPDRQPRAKPDEADKRGNLANTHLPPATDPAPTAGQTAADQADKGADALKDARKSQQTRERAGTGDEVRKTGTRRRQLNPAKPDRLRQKEP